MRTSSCGAQGWLAWLNGLQEWHSAIECLRAEGAKAPPGKMAYRERPVGPQIRDVARYRRWLGAQRRLAMLLPPSLRFLVGDLVGRPGAELAVPVPGVEPRTGQIVASDGWREPSRSRVERAQREALRRLRTPHGQDHRPASVRNVEDKALQRFLAAINPDGPAFLVAEPYDSRLRVGDLAHTSSHGPYAVTASQVGFDQPVGPVASIGLWGRPRITLPPSN